MADPRGGRREKVKINENSSSAGAIEKLPGAARGCEVGFETCWREYFFPPTLYLPIHLCLPPDPSSLDLRPRTLISFATETHSALCQLHRKARILFSHPRAFYLLSCPTLACIAYTLQSCFIAEIVSAALDIYMN